MGIYDSQEELYNECLRFQKYYEDTMEASSEYHRGQRSLLRFFSSKDDRGKDASSRASDLYTIRLCLYRLCGEGKLERAPPRDEVRRKNRYSWLYVIQRSQVGDPFYIEGFDVEFGESIIGDLITLSDVIGIDISYSDLL